MKMGRIPAMAGLIAALAASGPGLAQVSPPQVKLAHGIERDVLEWLWCAEIFLDEAYWLYQEDYLDGAATYRAAGEWLLEAVGGRFGGEEAAQARIEALRDAYREDVWDLGDFDLEGYWLALDACTEAFPDTDADPRPTPEAALPPLSVSARFAEAIAAYERRAHAEAFEMFAALADGGHAGAMFRLGEMYHLGRGVPHDLERSTALYHAAAEAGYPEAQYVVSRSYRYGTGVMEDLALSARWMERAANQAHAAAQHEFGLKLHYGEGVAPDREAAALWLTRAATQGVEAAREDMARLGLEPPHMGSFADGVAADQAGDYAAAYRIWHHHALSGEPAAQYNIGLMHMRAESVAQDDAEALRWYLLAANEGYPDAQALAGIFYATGQGTEQDHAEAAYWYRLAAIAGQVTAQNNLGGLYRAGRGVAQDHAEAAHWYGLAAAQGNANAQYNLGLHYRDGAGVPQDRAEAMRLFALAAAQGQTNAQTALAALEADGD